MSQITRNLLHFIAVYYSTTKHLIGIIIRTYYTKNSQAACN